ncbi:MAG: DUF427 domain-containing protein [Thermomicrobiales bacterium]
MAPSNKPHPIVPAPGQESVWDYPRPPRCEPSDRHVEVIFNGVRVADTRHAIRVLETSHPPVWYLPPEDVHLEYLHRNEQQTFCEFKGVAISLDVVVDETAAPAAAWVYPDPAPGFESIARYIAFYAGPMDACLVDGAPVVPQPGEFYGGWITPDVTGPFKGERGSGHW